MHSVQMLTEYVAIKEELLTEVTPGMRQDFSTTLTGRISMLNVLPQLLHVVDPLLANEDCAAFQADETESFLMRGLHMAP
mgnify:FL=1